MKDPLTFRGLFVGTFLLFLLKSNRSKSPLTVTGLIGETLIIILMKN